MRYQVAAQSLCGKVRKNNEDNFCLHDQILPLSHGDSNLIKKVVTLEVPHLLGVFDGMGGYNDGETASYLTALTAQKYADKLDNGSGLARTLIDLCMEANDKVCDTAKGNKMGTTCAMLCLSGSRYVVCNVGDSSIFLVRKGQMKQITVDHNQRATYEKATGKVAPPDQKFKLTQCIGIPKEDMLIEPYVGEGILQKGDAFVLCSEGITDMLDKSVIKDVVNGSDSAEAMATEMMRLALLAGGKDNLTVICVKVEEKWGRMQHIRNSIKKFFE